MGIAWPGLELWMELAGQQEWMVNCLDYFYQVIVWVDAAGTNAPRFELVKESIITLAAVTVTLNYFGGAVSFLGQATLG